MPSKAPLTSTFPKHVRDVLDALDLVKHYKTIRTVQGNDTKEQAVNIMSSWQGVSLITTVARNLWYSDSAAIIKGLRGSGSGYAGPYVEVDPVDDPPKPDLDGYYVDGAPALHFSSPAREVSRFQPADTAVMGPGPLLPGPVPIGPAFVASEAYVWPVWPSSGSATIVPDAERNYTYICEYYILIISLVDAGHPADTGFESLQFYMSEMFKHYYGLFRFVYTEAEAVAMCATSLAAIKNVVYVPQDSLR